MLEDHQRAAQIANEPAVAWHHFLRSRFVGRLLAAGGETGFAVAVQAIAQQSEFEAELRGCVEYFSDPSFPVVFEFVGMLQIETREISIQETPLNRAPRNYAGQFSENGRVLTLRLLGAERSAAKAFHLIHEETLTALLGG
jgi:hypothetical protein